MLSSDAIMRYPAVRVEIEIGSAIREKKKYLGSNQRRKRRMLRGEFLSASIEKV